MTNLTSSKIVQLPEKSPAPLLLTEIPKENNDIQTELEKIKSELLNELKPAKKSRKIAWSSLIVSTVLIILTVISTLQLIQSANILNKIKSGVIKPASAGTATPPSSPATLEKLPDMVGGC